MESVKRDGVVYQSVDYPRGAYETETEKLTLIEGDIKGWFERFNKVLTSNPLVRDDVYNRTRVRISPWDYVLAESYLKVLDPTESVYVHLPDARPDDLMGEMGLMVQKKFLARNERYGFKGPLRKDFLSVYGMPFWQRYVRSAPTKPDFEKIAHIGRMIITEGGARMECAKCKAWLKTKALQAVCDSFAVYTHRHEEEIAVAVYLKHGHKCNQPLLIGVTPTKMIIDSVGALFNTGVGQLERMHSYKDLKMEFETGGLSTAMSRMFTLDDSGRCVRTEEPKAVTDQRRLEAEVLQRSTWKGAGRPSSLNITNQLSLMVDNQPRHTVELQQYTPDPHETPSDDGRLLSKDIEFLQATATGSLYY